MNKILICGRLTGDPELRYSAGNADSCVCRYSVAVDRKYKKEGEQEADFFNCVAFNKSGEFASKYFRKGMKVAISGRMEADNYTNKDGQKVTAWKVLVDEQEFAESKNADNSASGTQKSAESNRSASGEGFMNIPDGVDDELPFN